MEPRFSLTVRTDYPIQIGWLAEMADLITMAGPVGVSPKTMASILSLFKRGIQMWPDAKDYLPVAEECEKLAAYIRNEAA